MQPPNPSATPTWHNDTYPAISPERPELSVEGKTVVITGAGGTIGGETAIAFASAHAKHVVLLGRDEAALKSTQERLPSGAESSIYHFDVIDEANTKNVASQIGSWDILVMCAGYMPDAGTIEQSDSSDWWKAFETNVRGTHNTVKSFLPTANPTQATIIGVTTAGFVVPASATAGLSSYISSKLAQAKLLEFVTAENSHISAFNVHPGCVQSAFFTKSGVDPTITPMDTAQLPGHFILWLASPEARFLDGRLVWANWDVAELIEQKDDLLCSARLTTSNFGFPYPFFGQD